MQKFIRPLAGVGLLLVAAAPAAAFQCPKLITAIENESGNRFDSGGSAARQLAAEAKVLHNAGNHKDAEKKAIDALALMGKEAKPTHK